MSMKLAAEHTTTFRVQARRVPGEALTDARCGYTTLTNAWSYVTWVGVRETHGLKTGLQLGPC